MLDSARLRRARPPHHSGQTIKHLALELENIPINCEKLAPEHKQYLLMHRMCYFFQASKYSKVFSMGYNIESGNGRR